MSGQVARQWGRAGGVVAVLVALLGGCVQQPPGPPKYVAPADLTPYTAARLTDIGRRFVYVWSVDGLLAPYPDRMGFFTYPDIRLQPGIHTVGVYYNDGFRASRGYAELTIPVEAGHAYSVQEWPPRLYDASSFQFVTCPIHYDHW